MGGTEGGNKALMIEKQRKSAIAADFCAAEKTLQQRFGHNLYKSWLFRCVPTLSALFGSKRKHMARIVQGYRRC